MLRQISFPFSDRSVSHRAARGTLRLGLLLGLLIAPRAFAQGGEPGVRFPDDAGYANIKTDFGARGDGIADDTGAFQRAIERNVRRLYLPHGTYLVSDAIVTGGKRWHLQGESEAGTIIRLKDHCSGFDDPENPKPIVSTFGRFMDPKSNMGQAFRNSVFDLTIDAGSGNPGAVGLHYLNNNQGTVRNVTIRSSDPERRGKAGLALVTNWPGPALIQDVTIEGFDIGVWSTISQYSLVFDGLTLRDQRRCGIENTAQTLTIRRLSSRNAGPAIESQGRASFVTLIDSRIERAAPVGGVEVPAPEAAILSKENASLYVRNLEVTGYPAAIRAEVQGETTLEPSQRVREFVSHPVLSATQPGRPTVFGNRLTPNLPIEEPPVFPNDPPERWANVIDFDATPLGPDVEGEPDSAPGIQRAIDSGRSTVYLPHGTYVIRTPVVVRGSVRRIMGMESRLKVLTGGEAAFRIADGDAPAVLFERLERAYASNTHRMFEHASTRSLVIRQTLFGGYRNTVPGGKVFLQDVTSSNWDFEGQRVWAWQLNTEAKGDGRFNLRLRDTDFWCLGLKTEGPKTVIEAEGGQIELLGGFFYPSRGTDDGAAAFELAGTTFSGGWVNHLGGHYRPQARSKPPGPDAAFFLHVDFGDRHHLPLHLRWMIDGDRRFEHVASQRKPNPIHVWRHGSYGVKVPRFVVEPDH